MSAESTVIRNYLETLVSTLWGKQSKINKDLFLALSILDRDHYGLKS